jgi:hypothetical protein
VQQMAVTNNTAPWSVHRPALVEYLSDQFATAFVPMLAAAGLTDTRVAASLLVQS